MNEDIIREITFPTYPKDVLLNAFHHKKDDAVYISVKKKWAALLASPNFCGCSFSANREKDIPRIHFMTLTPSTRYSESWQLTHYDGEGPYGHGSYSDTNREAGHTMRELVCELAGYSADREITARAHFLSQEGNNANGYKEQKMTYFQCIKLLEACIKNGILASDPDDANRLLVYRGAGKTAPEGWYSEPVMSVAQELLLHTEEQELLVKELEKKGVTFECTETQDADTRLLSSKFKEE